MNVAQHRLTRACCGTVCRFCCLQNIKPHFLRLCRQVALVLSADGTRKAMADRLQAPRSANEGRTAGHTDSRMSVRARMLPDHQLLLLHANPAGFVLGGVHMVEDAVDDSKVMRNA